MMRVICSHDAGNGAGYESGFLLLSFTHVLLCVEYSNREYMFSLLSESDLGNSSIFNTAWQKLKLPQSMHTCNRFDGFHYLRKILRRLTCCCCCYRDCRLWAAASPEANLTSFSSCKMTLDTMIMPLTATRKLKP